MAAERTWCCTRRGQDAQPEHRSRPTAASRGLPAPVTCHQTRSLSALPGSCGVLSAPSLLIHLNLAPNLDSKTTSFRLSSVFPDLLCDVDYTLPWTWEPPNPVLRHPSSAHPSLCCLDGLSCWTGSSVRAGATSDSQCPQHTAQANNAAGGRRGRRWSYHPTKPLTQVFGHRISLKGPHRGGGIERYALTI